MWLGEIRPGDLITIIEEMDLDFLSRYLDIEEFLRKEIEGIQTNSPLDRDIHFKILYLAGTWMRKRGVGDGSVYLQKALRMLRRKKDKTPREIYRMASLEKQLNQWTRAAESFKSLITGSVSGKLTAGAFFHLGEMAFEKSAIEEAREYFRKSLEDDGGHIKSREYLSKIGGFS